MFFTSNNVQGLKLPCALAQEVCLQDIDQKNIYLFLLLYADDTIVLAECPEDLQRALDILKIYCEFWGFDINVRKTKVMVFSRGKIRKMPKFNFNEETVDVVWDYKYLGIKFNYNAKFKMHNSYSFRLQTVQGYVFTVKEMSAAKFATRYTIRTFLKNVCTQSFCMVVKYGRARRWM